MRWRTTSATYSAASVATITTTMAVMANTSLVFRRKAGMDQVQSSRRSCSRYSSIFGHHGPSSGQLQKILSARGVIRRGRRVAIFLEFIVQGLQADAQDLSGARLVVVVRSQRLQDQQFFRFAHRGPDLQ